MRRLATIVLRASLVCLVCGHGAFAAPDKKATIEILIRHAAIEVDLGRKAAAERVRSWSASTDYAAFVRRRIAWGKETWILDSAAAERMPEIERTKRRQALELGKQQLAHTARRLLHGSAQALLRTTAAQRALLDIEMRLSERSRLSASLGLIANDERTRANVAELRATLKRETNADLREMHEKTLAVAERVLLDLAKLGIDTKAVRARARTLTGLDDVAAAAKQIDDENGALWRATESMQRDHRKTRLMLRASSAQAPSVLDTMGSVTLTDRRGEARPARRATLRPGDVLRAGPGSAVAFGRSDGSVVEVGHGAHVRLSDPAVIALESGRLRYRVLSGHLPEALATVRIGVGGATIETRGADVVCHRAGSVTELLVRTGTATVVTQTGAQHVAAGHKVTLQDGAITGGVKPLAPGAFELALVPLWSRR